MSWLWPEELWLDMGVLLLAMVLDLVLPEPPTAIHPVVWMGNVTRLLERLAPRSGRVLPFLVGVGIALVAPAIFGGASWAAASWLRQVSPAAYLVGGAVLLRTTFTVRGAGTALPGDSPRHGRRRPGRGAAWPPEPSPPGREDTHGASDGVGRRGVGSGEHDRQLHRPAAGP